MNDPERAAPRGPKVLFYTTGGSETGFGHLRRCLSLAHALRARHVESAFALYGRDAPLELVRRAGFPAAAAPPPSVATSRAVRAEHGALFILADGYAIRPAHIAAMRAGGPIGIIDDLACDAWEIDLLVNGAASASARSYPGIEPSKLLLGPAFALLRPEFAAAPSRQYPRVPRRLLVMAGGADRDGLTALLVEAALPVATSAMLDVVLGPFTEPAPFLARFSGSPRVVAHHDPDNLRALMLRADLALTGGGQTLYELAATATPTIAVRVAENQTANLTGLESAGVLVRAGDVGQPDLRERVAAAVATLSGDRGRREALGRRGRATVDGQGASRVAAAIERLLGGATDANSDGR